MGGLPGVGWLLGLLRLLLLAAAMAIRLFFLARLLAVLSSPPRLDVKLSLLTYPLALLLLLLTAAW